LLLQIIHNGLLRERVKVNSFCNSHACGDILTAIVVRGPCPGLNTLSNHGILPRNGKGLTVSMLTNALKDTFNVGADFTAAIATAGLLSSPYPLERSFNLDDLDRHNFPIEHDASLSRNDANLGEDHSLNQTIFNVFLKHFEGNENITLKPAAEARYHRLLTELGRDSEFTFSTRDFVNSYGETALYLSTMGDPLTGVAPVKYVKVLFGM
jgi:Peroxidase, family 2